MVIGSTVTENNTIYDELGNAYDFQTTYEKTAANTYNITYELLDMDGNPTSPAIGPTTVEAVFDGDPTNGEMISLNGNNPPEAINIQNVSLGIDFNYDPTNVVQRTTETLSSSVDNNRDSTIVSGTVSIFDSLGNAHTLTLKYTKIDDNSWTWRTEIPASSGTLSGNSGSISFNPDGSISSISPNPPVVTFLPEDGASQQNIVLNFGEDLWVFGIRPFFRVMLFNMLYNAIEALVKISRELLRLQTVP